MDRLARSQTEALSYLLRARRRTLGIAAAAGLILGWTASGLAPTQYRAQSYLALDADSVDLSSRLAGLGSADLRDATIARLLFLPVGPQEPNWEHAVRAAVEGIDIELAPDDSTVSLTCRSPHARAAAAAVNALAESIVEYDRHRLAKSVSQADDRIRRQLEGLSNRDEILALIAETGLGDTGGASVVHVANRANVPTQPIGLGGFASASAGLILGLLFGLAHILVRHRLDNTFKQPGDASRVLGIPELGMVPAAAYEHSRERMTPAGVAPAAPPPAERTAIDSRPSWLAECVRGVRTSLVACSEAPRIVVVTSALGGEGKTTVAANLAGSFAESGRRTLLVDADLRNPKLCEHFSVSNSEGLVDLLQDQEREPSDLWADIAENLWLLPAGVALHGGPGVLHEPLAYEFFIWLRRQFDVIVVDSPPTLTGSDARALAAIADGTVLVVRAGTTNPDAAIEAKSVLESDGVNLIGVVLNSWEPRAYGPATAASASALPGNRAVA